VYEHERYGTREYILNDPYDGDWHVYKDLIKNNSIKQFFETEEVKKVLNRFGHKKDELEVNAMNYKIKKNDIKNLPEGGIDLGEFGIKDYLLAQTEINLGNDSRKFEDKYIGTEGFKTELKELFAEYVNESSSGGKKLRKLSKRKRSNPKRSSTNKRKRSTNKRSKSKRKRSNKKRYTRR
jgi:hypothetical protein